MRVPVLGGFLALILLYCGWMILQVRRTLRRIAAFEQKFWSGIDLDKLFVATKDDKSGAFDPSRKIFVAMMAEWRRGFSKTGEARGNPVLRCRDVGQVEVQKWYIGASTRLIPLEILQFFLGPIFGITAALLGLVVADPLSASSGIGDRVAAVFEVTLTVTIIASVGFVTFRLTDTWLRLAQQMLTNFVTEFANILDRVFNQPDASGSNRG